MHEGLLLQRGNNEKSAVWGYPFSSSFTVLLVLTPLRDNKQFIISFNVFENKENIKRLSVQVMSYFLQACSQS